MSDVDESKLYLPNDRSWIEDISLSFQQFLIVGQGSSLNRI